ncbi:DUF6350 family protein [Demequina sp. SYSU T00039]|uniref:DUF6350 family protein n=1 Tax=Demequina lignilytica TaxID=3051663 RepID=A0AAW7M5R1_9MICO|nr:MULTISPECIES: DUF6350 family protein [unclassified Demequina]MDN4478193.1 DUF6350 family protein [Demequina sp. SYSU T00039-1]MDN4488357.1 DUF6350 family protein [Demequina sp. SYSU T00039]
MPADAPAPSRLERLRDALPGWAGGLLTGVQGAVLSYLVVLAPALAAIAGAPSLDGSATVDWGGASTVATHVWLLGHGVPVVAGGVTVSLVPLGLPLLSGLILAGVARRFATKSWISWALACASFASSAGLIAGLATAATDTTGDSVARATTVAAVIAAPAVAIGIWRAYGARLHLLDRLPGEVRGGLRLGLATLGLLWLAAGALSAAFAVLGRVGIAEMATGLGLDPLGAGALAIAELAYVPTMVAWGLTWLIGPGFVVGAGSLYAPDTLTAGAVPDVPLLGALPTVAGGWWAWAPVGVVVIAAIVRIALRWRLGIDWASARAGGVALASVAVGLTAVTVLSRGSLGAPPLDVAGAEPVPVVILGTSLTALGYAAVWGTMLLWRWVRARTGAPAPVVHEPARAGTTAS